MKRYDGLYGKLVKDWGLEEWTRFYHEHYSTDKRTSEIGDHVKRLFCGPYFTDSELAEYVNADAHTFVTAFDGPLGMLREGAYVNWDLSLEEQQARRKEYYENYPSPPVAEHVFKRLGELQNEAIERSLSEPISTDVEGMSAAEAGRRIGSNFWCERKGYCGNVEQEHNAREYAYIVARYPDLRSDNPDSMWAGNVGYTRFYQQYVDYFADLNDAELKRLDKCRRLFGMATVKVHLWADSWCLPENINYCDTADGCWIENQLAVVEPNNPPEQV